MNVLRRAVFDLRRVDFDQWGVVPVAIPELLIEIRGGRGGRAAIYVIEKFTKG